MPFAQWNNLRVRALAADSQGRIGLAGGVLRTEDPEDDTTAAAVARLTKDGAVDTSFGTDGIAKNADGFSNFAMDLAIDTNDRLVTAGYVQSNGDGRAAFEVTRRLPDGSPDQRFAKEGVGTYQITDAEGCRQQCSPRSNRAHSGRRNTMGTNT